MNNSAALSREDLGESPTGRWDVCASMCSALSEAYAKTKRATAIDYAKVLHWVVTDDATGRSKLGKPPDL